MKQTMCCEEYALSPERAQDVLLAVVFGASAGRSKAPVAADASGYGK